MQKLNKHKLNPVASWETNPEEFILEHCGNLATVSGNLEDKVLAFVRKLLKNNVPVPPLDINLFPKDFKSEGFFKMIEVVKTKSKKAA